MGGAPGRFDNGGMAALPTSLTLGSLRVETPVVLAPMAGITNAAYRRLCAEQGAGLYVSEMITSRGLVEGDETTQKMLVFDELETVRSVQLYGTDPVYIGKAVEILCADHGVAHVDLNFGCPVPKVTRKGGGGALPWKRGLLGEILEHAVAAAAPYDVPVTMKTRKGLDDDHLTYLDAGRIAQETGVAAIALHGRTVQQAYSGQADWDAIAALVAHVDLPVLGNGDIWEAADALRMVEQTGAAGVVVGRGCLGRPWLFRDLAAAFNGEVVATMPTLGEVRTMMRRHAELLSEHMGEERGLQGVPQARRVVPQGLPGRRRAAPPAGPRRLPRHPRRPARRARPGRDVPGARARHAPRQAGRAPQEGGAPRGVARRHRRPRVAPARGRERDHRRLTGPA